MIFFRTKLAESAYVTWQLKGWSEEIQGLERWHEHEFIGKKCFMLTMILFKIIFCQEIVGLKYFTYFHKRQLHVWLIALQNRMSRGKGKNDVYLRGFAKWSHTRYYPKTWRKFLWYFLCLSVVLRPLENISVTWTLLCNRYSMSWSVKSQLKFFWN